MRVTVVLLAAALGLPAPASAALDGAGWDVAPSRYRIDPAALHDQGSERGPLRVPRLSVLFEGARPLDLDTQGETPAAGGGLRLSFEVPLLFQLSVGTYVASGHRGAPTDGSGFTHLLVTDAGAFARLRTSVHGTTFFIGAHGGYTHFVSLHGADARGQTWHSGAHAGIHAGRRRTGFELVVGFNTRRWSGGDSDFQATFHGELAELYGSLGFFVRLGGNR